MLEIIDADTDGGRVLTWLVGRQAATLEECAADLGAPPDVVRSALDDLERSQLVTRVDGDPVRYQANDPTPVLRPVLEERQGEIDQARRRLADLTESYTGAHARGVPDDLMLLVVGRSSIRAHLERVQASATQRYRVLTGAPFVIVEPAAQSVRRVVVSEWARVVYARDAFESPEVVSAVQLRPAHAHVRVVDRARVKLVVADETEALLTSRDVVADGVPTALLVRDRGMIHFLVDYFDEVWRGAVPLPAAAGEPARDSLLDDADQRLMTLLLTGMTDRAAAASLGVSLRSVQRRVGQLSLAAGATSRLALGWQAARRGWLDDAQP